MSFIADLGDWLRKVSRSFSDVSVNGQNIILTRHNGDTTTITTQDTNTTYNPASQSADGLMSATDKVKLDGITAGAEPNQNAFSNVKVDTTTIAADDKTDTLELVAGTGITLTPDATTDKITVKVIDNMFAADAHTHADYVKKTGDTMTGALTAPTFNGDLNGTATRASLTENGEELDLKKGTSYLLSTVCIGYVSSGRQTVRFCVPIQKIFPTSIWTATNPALTINTLDLRHVAGGTISTASLISAVSYAYSVTGLVVVVNFSSALAVTNNTPVAVNISARIVFS